MHSEAVEVRPVVKKGKERNADLVQDSNLLEES